MSAKARTYPVVAYWLNVFGEWLKHRRELGELRRLDDASLNQIAGDLRISPGALNQLVRQGPHSADELPRLLKALGIDGEKLARTEPLVLRDMERVCSLCSHKRRCDHDLADGTSPARYPQYCPNAPTIEGLGEPTGR
ncbi:helix-turn-helix transcriptional regulator [Bradyrhizobium lablabi]|uniref:helix-turn-helix domain-containing protein n=1 Tax=Bradyrhizobium lablabi TaxID=722472 RepID=UPI001BA5225E|nr:helix-turn-helix domain-containing protein [Bradyrhizobium lablabi]MBR0695392.1 helix-turn-helix transcriptional regulator [Bradyrhizobium lablabi]